MIRKRVGIIIDEWGTWYDVEPGTNPGFLYQQNTMRDALVAGINFNIFHKHCNRVQMTNIAQTINVLQSVILTNGSSLIKTPTYHVFNMYKVHQDAEALEIACESPMYRHGDETIEQISVSASMDDTGAIHVSLCNLDPEQSSDIRLEMRGTGIGLVSGKVLTGKTMNAHNTFEAPDVVSPVEFTDFTLDNNVVQVKLPSMSVVTLKLDK